jgi:2-dehydro-3-deoxyphosphogluconate aldolase / (4S)-4-hydroxy-2-oxoglutarate aldolase
VRHSGWPTLILIPPMPASSAAAAFSQTCSIEAVFRAPTAEHFVPASEVLWDAGVRCFEYTLTTEGALDALVELRKVLSEAHVGVGTVRTVGHLRAASDAGAEFAVSQIFLPELVVAAREQQIAFIPGALTPTEIVTAWNAGAPAVKVSPIGPLGGVSYLKELRGPLPDVAIMPTGGVTLDAAAHYLDAGAVAVGVSGALLGDVLLGGDLAALSARAEQLMSSVSRLGPSPAVHSQPDRFVAERKALA